MLFSG